jgi:predicted ATP-dependent endonuclease of OLD family
VDAQTIAIEDDVTSLVGKNESGKTTILKALHRLKPANGADLKFDLTTEYPRWRLARDRRNNEALAKTKPIVARFALDDADLAAIEGHVGIRPPATTVLVAAKDYENSYFVWLDCEDADVITQAAVDCQLADAETKALRDQETIAAATEYAKQQAKELKEAGDALTAKAFTSFGTAVGKYQPITSGVIADDDARDALGRMVPKFFYFSAYNLLPGECDLTALAAKAVKDRTDPERSVVALLAHAGEKPEDFMDADYDSRKAELQAASVDLSRNVFEYWRQNTDLEVVFDTDNLLHETDPTGNQINHRILKIELRDGRHGNVETNFSTRSTGFQWFFSFFAAFSEYQDSSERIVVLLDEPGTSLHGDAQADFVRFVFNELGNSKQTIYTTHSQHMIDPAKYEKLRAVHDRATREDPNLGVTVSLIDLAADRSTLLPVESALGYSVSQHLFIGSGQHLTVEGSSDFVYLQRFTEHQLRNGKEGLDPRLSILPVGGIDNMPAFVALLGRRLKVSALVDGDRTNAKLARIKLAAEHNGVPDSHIVVCSDVDPSLPKNADVEDLFVVEDYLKLYNWAFNKSLAAPALAATDQPIIKRIKDVDGEFDHAIPAHALTMHRDEFFASVDPVTVENFDKLFAKLNATVDET